MYIENLIYKQVVTLSITQSPGEKPDVQAISELTERLRAVRTVGWSKQLDRPSDDGKHLANNLNRNFAVLQLCLDNGQSIGLEWLGVSGKPNYSLPPILNKSVILASETDDFMLNVKELLDLDHDTVFEPCFAPLPGTKMTCSEVPLLNGLGFWLQARSFPKDATGHLYLLTERLPCLSCGHVMHQFKQGYPNFQIHLLYMFDHTDRASERLATDLTNVADSVHLVEVMENSDTGFVGLRGPAFGSPATPVRSPTTASPIVPVESKSGGGTIRILPVNARKLGDLMVVPTSNASEVISRGAGSPSAHFIANILPGSRSKPDF